MDGWADDCRRWIGRSETSEDVAARAPALRLAATLDRGDLTARLPAPDATLPPLWHWLYVMPCAPQSKLGSDGHPARGGFLPPVPLPCRMWAGSRLEFRAPIAFGDALVRNSTIVNVQSKSGRSGALAFVTVRHEIRADGRLAIVDEHDIVYREAPRPGAPAPAQREEVPRIAQFRRTVAPDPVLLFRYSALTFNGHRIHYDRSYATQVEGYPGLVVPGPLQATLLLDLLDRELPGARVARFAFRALAPLFDTAPFEVCGAREAGRICLWIETPDGAIALDATAELAWTPFDVAAMQLPHPDRYQDLRDGVRALCSRYPDAYWREVDARRGYPEAFVDALTRAGWLAALIPQEYGGAGLGLAEALVIMEEINRNGGSAGAHHGQMYNMATLLRHGSDPQKRHYLPRIARGELCLQSMGVTEPAAGTDTTNLKTTAVKKGDRYVVNGQKVWISRIQHSDLMILLARTTSLAQVARKSDGLSIFLVDLREAIGRGMTVRPIPNMVNHETNEIFFDNLEIPAENLIGEEGKGFRYILDGLNAERALIAAECIGDGWWFVNRAAQYAAERVVFGRPIGRNQGVQFPIAESYMEVEAANLMRFEACRRFDARLPYGAQANMAKHLAAKASWEAANVCLQTHGGFGFACEYDVERKFRETRLYLVAPISTNLVQSYVAEHVLGLPRLF